MSRSTERVKVGDLSHLKRDALEEILIREEKLLSNQRLIRSLPDKGKKIVEYAEKVRLAIQNCDEEERQQAAARAKLQLTCQQYQFVSEEPVENMMAPAAAPTAAAEASDESKDLAKSLDLMSMSDKDTEVGTESRLARNHPEENYFFKAHAQKKQYSCIVPDNMDSTNPGMRPKFKPNALHQRENISAQDRKVQDRKHLDDITAATLPPLHYSLPRLLSLEESANLLQEQMKKTRELQAKLAAQKLSEGLMVSMGSYSPGDGPMARYREAHNEENQHSDED